MTFETDITQPDQSSDLTVASAIWRRRWLVVGIALAMAVAGSLAASNSAGEYTSTAGMVLQDPNTVFLDRATAAGDERRYIASQIAIIRSQTISEAASELLAGADEPIVLAPQVLRSSITLSSDDESNFVELTVRSDDKDVAQAATAAVLEAYRVYVLDSQVRSVEDAIGRLDGRIDELDDLLRELEETSGSQTTERIEELSAELAGLPGAQLSAEERLAEAERIQAELEAWRVLAETTASLPAGEVRQLEIEQTLALLEDLRERRNLLEVRTSIVDDGITVTSSPDTPSESGVGATSAIIVSFFLGLVLAAGLAYWLETRRHSVTDRRQPARHLRTRMITEIPELPTTGRRRARPGGLVAGEHETESFRFLAYDLEAGGHRDTTTGWTLAFVGVRSQSGTSMIAGNVARSAARHGRSVVVLDGDIDRGDVSSALLKGTHVKNPSITDLLALDPAKALPQLKPAESFGGGGTLTVIQPGGPDIDRFVGFQNDRVAALLDALERRFDMVVIDSPALLDVAHGTAFVTSATSTVIVVRHETSVNDLDLAARRLELLEVEPLGYVYNHVPAWVKTPAAVRVAG